MSAVWSRTVERSDDGALRVGGCDVRDLAGQYGTPLYIVDEVDMRARAAAFRDHFTAAFGRHGARCDVFYASKSFLSSRVARWMLDEDLNMDVASGGELEIALRGGMPPARIALHGNNKSDAEIERALKVGVGRLVVDSLDEIAIIDAIAFELGVTAPVMVRVTTGVHAGGHEYIATAHEDQKFGLSLASGAAIEALRRVHASDSLELQGIHTHIGSQILSIGAFRESATRMLRLRAEFAAESGVEVPEVDLGGGYAISYVPGTQALEPRTAAFEIADAVADALAEAGGTWPRFSIEPGRAISGPAGMTLYRVGVVKTVDLEEGGHRTYVAVDGGMSDNMRPITYGADYTATLAARLSEEPPRLSRVVGKHCESGDIVVRNVELPGDVNRGDLLAVAATGAYGRTMSNNYNALLRPAVVSVKDGDSTVHIRRDTMEDLLSWDVAPA
ncbi:diaminopimelate decarboxylase [Demequina capsici]|uniref:Diaminopimelate decarboxylase n=1 Tax=Demequina capsici TaxID=3075620 RepID=A0AA96FBH2_9MICO|nr:diaminopimelate decarboxylase [Demequina sp. PMTSA13]WNM26663.1 diaminopimelate decarboxylase [Demequina sp. PMTSA13]